MRKRLLLLALLMAIFAPWAANAQTTVTIGEGTSTTYYAPINSYYSYSITEQLYTATEIGTAGTINSISFYWAYSAEKNYDITVYMANVDAENLSTGISLADAAEVFDGNIVVPSTAGWVTIDLDTPFAYDGTSNLLIGVNKTDGSSWFSGSTWQYTSATNMVRYSQNDSSPYTTSTTPGTAGAYRPNIQMVITAGSGPVCEKPETFEASNVTTNSATLTWTGGSGKYNIELNGTVIEENYAGYTYNLANLTPATTYAVRVQSVCDDATSSWKSVSFTTACGVITTFPWTETFERYASGNFSDPCWVNEHISGSGTSVFQISTSSNAGNSTHQLQLPDMSEGTLTKLVLPEMTLPANYEFSIDIYRSSSTYNDNYPYEGIRVFASTNGEIEGATELAFIPRHFEVSNDVIPAESAVGWYTYELPIGMSGTCYIILRGESQYCTSTYMDNLAVKEIPTCLKPTGLAVTANSITAHSATITWTSDADAWQICLNNDEENLIDVTETTYTFTGLTSETSYSVKVRTNCDGDYSEFTLPVSFTTAIACPAPTGLTCNALTSNSATLSWTETGTATSWDIHYSTDATFNTYSSAQADDTPTVTLNNLTPETVYYARVQAYCGGEDGVSAFSTTVSFEPTAKIVIGSGTLTTSYLPSNTNYNYSYTQQIYTTEELGEAGVIESIDFYMTSTTNYTRNLDVYMVSTTKNAFENTSDWISVTSSDLVFSGEVNFAAQAWTTITLSEGFVYDGTQNVAIIIDDNTGVYSSRSFRSFNGQSNQSIYKYQDGSNIDPSQAPAGTCTSSKNQIRILKDEMPDCIKPTNLTATEVAPDYAVLSWSQYGEVAAWNVEVTDVAQATTTTWTANAIPFTLVGLSNETEYSVKVSPDCDQTLWSDAITFTTLEGCPAPENLAVNGIAHYTATATWTGYATSYEVTLGWNGEPNTLLSVDFAGGIPTDWTNGSTYPWELVDGYIKTTNVGVSSSTSSISFTKTYPANGTIEFDAECMGEGSSSFYDHCDFYIDDERMLYAGANISGWNHYSFQVTAGEHTFTWSYTKDSSVNPTGDYFAIDNVVLQTSAIVWGDPITTTDTEFTFEGLNANTDYYVKVQSFCPAEGAISEVSFTTLSEDYKLFVTEGEWKEGSNWSPIGVPTIEQDVELRANATITEVAEAKSITQGNYTITIEDGGQLIHNSTGVTATVKKTIAPWTAKGGYYFISNPLTSNITPSEENGLLSGNYDLYDWNAIASDGNEWRNYRAQTFTLSYGLYGYLYANEVGADLSFTGTIRSSQNNQSRYVYAYTSTDYDFGTWSLLGNPFVCNAYLVNAYTNGTALPFYKMNADGDGYDAVIGEPIAPMEGIFYAAEDAGSVYMSRTAPAPASDGKLNMNLRSANKQLDNAILVFGGNQRLGKMSFRDNSSKIYMPVEGKDYAIVNAEEMGEMPVNFKAENNGSYTLSFNAEEVSFAYLHLIDNMTGTEVNLLETPSYSFEANTTDYANRFKLVFATGNNGDDDTFAFFSNGSFVINNEGNATVQVIDVNGRILSSETINGCANLNVKAAAGVYMIRLVNGDNVKVQKVVVR